MLSTCPPVVGHHFADLCWCTTVVDGRWRRGRLAADSSLHLSYQDFLNCQYCRRFKTVMVCKASNVLLLIFILGNTLAWDGCEWANNWKCGNLCIHSTAECNCGGRVFNYTAPMWCCQESNCRGKGSFWEQGNAWFGEKDEEGRRIGAEHCGYHRY